MFYHDIIGMIIVFLFCLVVASWSFGGASKKTSVKEKPGGEKDCQTAV